MSLPIWLVAVGIGLLIEACGSGDDDGNGNGRVDGDADAGDGDAFVDGVDADGDTVPDGDTVEGDGIDCSTPREGINDNYAATVFSSTPCVVKDMDISGSRILGVCDYPLNRVFACQILSDPMESTSCTSVFSIEPRSELPDGTFVNNNPKQLIDLGDGRIVALYDSGGDQYPHNLAIIGASTYTRLQEDIALPVAMTITSGTDPITVRTSTAQGIGFIQGDILIPTRNFDSSTGVYTRGTVLIVNAVSRTDPTFNPSDIEVIFTNGRNPAGMATIDADTVAVLNAHGPDGTIPETLGPSEVAGASIDFVTGFVDTTEPIYSVERTIPIAGVEMQPLPELTLTQDKTTAVVGSAAIPPTIYKVTLGDGTVRQVTLPAEATGNIASIALSESGLILVSLTDGYLYEVDLSTMAVTGSSTYLGSTVGPSDDGVVLYQSVIGPWCGEADESRIIAVDYR